MQTSAFKKQYGYVVLASMGIGIQCFFTGYGVAMRARNKYFNDQYLQENFGDIHQREVGTPMPKLGYPDNGSGIYSQKLTYKQWFELNNAQRCHQNYVEHVGIVIPATLIAGWYYPIPAAVLGFGYITGRVAYTMGYMTEKGANGREMGAKISGVCWLLQFGLGILTGIKMIRGH